MRPIAWNARIYMPLLAVLFSSVLWERPIVAQSQNTRDQDIQQLKDKLQQLEQMIG